MIPFHHFVAFLRRFFRRAPAPPARREPRPRPEPLESRIAPATLVNPHVVTYLDAQNHLVTIKSSLPIFTSATVADDILSFDTGNVAQNSNATAETLKRIDFTAILSGAPGESISVTDGGKNTADVGAIVSSHHLGSVTVQGDLGQITAGESIGTGSSHATGVAHLTVHALGGTGQLVATKSLVSTINGSLGSLIVDTDFSGASLKVISNLNGAGNIGSVHLGGSLAGGADANSGSISAAGKIGAVSIAGSITGADGNKSGTIIGTGALAKITVRGSIAGGNGDNSGGVSAKNIGVITVAGALQGKTFGGYAGTASTPPTALDSGQIVTTGGGIHRISLGDLIGAGGMGSGSIMSDGLIGSIALHKAGTGATATTGSITGGAGAQSGSIVAGNGTSFSASLGSLHVAGSVTGGAGDHSGEVNIGGTIGTVTIGGGLVGSQGVESGSIASQDSVAHISLGTLTGGGVASAGQISVGNNLGSLTISNTGAAADTGLVEVAGNTGTISIKGGVLGASAAQPGEILIGGALKTLKVGGSLQGGATDDSGSIFAGLDGISRLGSATITGGILGGSGTASGQLSSGGSLGHVSSGAVTGGAGGASGSIATGGALGRVSLQGDLTGGSGPNSGQISSGSTMASVMLHGALTGGGSILSHTLSTPDAVTAGNIGTITITKGISGGRIDAEGNLSHLSVTGDVTGTSGVAVIQGEHLGVVTISGVLHDGSIQASEDIASLSLGSVTGEAGAPVIISAVGQASPGKTSDLAFGKISIGGDLSFTNILAGYDSAGNAVNGDASIGPVTVKGNWTGGNLVAGVKIGADNLFGTADDGLISPLTKVIPKIASVVIKGHIESTTSSTVDHYGFVAEEIAAFSVGGKALKLTKTANVPDIYDPASVPPNSPDPTADNDTAVREVIT